MPEIALQPETELWVEIPGSITINGKDYKRKLLVTTLNYNPTDKRVLTEGTMKFFDKNEDDTFGDLAEKTMLVQDYSVRMIADNETLCDVMTGIPICLASQQVFEDVTEDVTETIDGEEVVTQVTNRVESESSPTFGRNYAKQYDWFFNLAQTQQVNINEMIRQFYLFHWSVGKVD